MLDTERLRHCWFAYQMAMRVEPYNPVLVQAWGLAFAYHYNQHKAFFCERYGVPEDEFNYAIKHELMDRLEEEYRTDILS